MKPILKYPGGKSKELSEIKKYVPEFAGKYYEPFFGGGALFFDLEPKEAVINDINSDLMDFYIGIRDDFDIVTSELKLIQKEYEKNRTEYESLKEKSGPIRVEDNNECLYYKMRDIFNGETGSNLHPATVYFYMNKTSYSGMIRYNKAGKFNVPYGRYKNFNTNLITKQHSLLLQNSSICSGSYKKIFDMANDGDFVFLDPPYDCIFSDYGNIETKDGFTEEMHRELAKDFRNLKAKALMVISKTPLIEELYGDLIVYEYDKTYAVNIRNRFKSEAKHVVLTNY